MPQFVACIILISKDRTFCDPYPVAAAKEENDQMITFVYYFFFLLELSSNPSLASILIPAHARSQAAASTPTNASATTGQDRASVIRRFPDEAQSSVY